LTNATKHTGEQGRIQVSSRHTDGMVEVVVADTGVGIEAEDLPRIFDRFWRSRGRGKGTGLGLAIAKGLVEAHGGRIQVDSTPGVGSTFTFTLPERTG
jgi:signal transduction histidine kinase